MDNLYSVTLLVSLVSGSFAAAIVALEVMSLNLLRSLRRFVAPACLIAWAALFVSVVVHLGWGHTPGSAAALPPGAFLREHSAFIPAGLLPAIAVLIRRGRR